MAQPTTVVEILADANIRLKRLTPGHTEHVICPKCHGGNSRETSLAVSIDADGRGAVWNCHRGSCGYQDGARTGSGSVFAVEPPRVIRRPQPHTAKEQDNRPQWFHDFFGERNIGDRTVRAFGVYATNRWFPDPVGTSDAIVFPYVFNGELVNRKYRPFPAKNPMMQDKDAEPTLFNIDRLGDAPAEIVWVEGEMDVLAMFECQIEHAVSLKDGAPSQAKTDGSFAGNDKRFEALRTHDKVLGKAKRIVLAGDMDGPGRALREELARRLGRHRCYIAEWPDGCKDACDTLRLHGPDAVKDAVAAAAAYPISGLQRIKAGSLLALRHASPPSTMTTGTRATDQIVKLPTEGRLVVVTGYPSHGKTTWTRFVMVHTAKDHQRCWAVFSPEMQPWEQFVAECAEVFIGKPFWPKAELPGMTDEEVVHAEMWLGNKITMLVCDSEDEAPTLEWILERARLAVLRDGVTDLVIDPWNEIDHQRGTMSETDYIGRGLQRLKAFGLRHGCNIWIIAHPVKPQPLKPGETRPVPGPYEISGSSHWANKTDLGITVHSPTPGMAEVHTWKTRFRRWGVRGSVANLEFDEMTGRFETPIKVEATPKAQWANSGANR